MLKYVIAYAATAVVFFGLDFVWLSRMLGFYRSEMGGLLLEQPKLGFAAGFYALYVVGIVALVVVPALGGGGWGQALLMGALLGLVAYGTYDMTNMSTLKGWSLNLALVDMAWGTFVTAVAASAGYFVTAWLAP
ncbi:DUF2177 family protein [Devosia sp. CN2-171]|uniref:DUF2177 family protein n=1 Tax=Devosia sp. CN2-171 TaxID=3400909 RepID=UPI003BF89A1E